jgi:hypothetical protein
VALLAPASLLAARMTVAPRGASTSEPMPEPKSRSDASCQRCRVRQRNQHPAFGPPRKIRRPWATGTWLVSVPTRALALRAAEILVIPPSSTNAGCGETWRALLRAPQSRIWRLWSGPRTCRTWRIAARLRRSHRRSSCKSARFWRERLVCSRGGSGADRCGGASEMRPHPVTAAAYHSL